MTLSRVLACLICAVLLASPALAGAQDDTFPSRSAVLPGSNAITVAAGSIAAHLVLDECVSRDSCGDVADTSTEASGRLTHFSRPKTSLYVACQPLLLLDSPHRTFLTQFYSFSLHNRTGTDYIQGDLEAKIDAQLSTASTPLDQSSHAVGDVGSNTRSFEESLAAAPFQFILSSGFPTNESFANAFCSQLSTWAPAALTMTSQGDIPSPYVIPDCMRTNGSTIRSLIVTVASNVLILSNFSRLPLNLSSVTLTNMNVQVLGETDEYDGFDGNGNLVWDEIWTALPNLTTLSIDHGNLKGPIPTSLPEKFIFLSLPGAGLTGTISPQLFSKSNESGSLWISLPNNALSGSIPDNIFAPLTGGSKSKFYMDFSFCGLSGSIPANIFQPLQTLNTSLFNIILNNNQLDGSLPSFPPAIAQNFLFNAAYNSLTGTLPPSPVPFSTVYGMTYNVAHNSLSGSLPSQFFADDWVMTTPSTIVIDLSYNSLTGSIASTFLSGGLFGNASALALSLILDHNQLSGPIPADLLYNTVTMDSTRSLRDGDDNIGARDFSSSTSSSSSALSTTTYMSWQFKQSVLLSMLSNKLSGTLPSNLLSHALATAAFSATFDVSNNVDISGSIPSNFFEGIPDTGTTITHSLTVSNTSVSGPLPAGVCRRNQQVNLKVASTLVNGSFPTEWEGCKFASLYVMSCPNLITTIRSDFFTNNTITVFYGTKTPFFGLMPTMSSNTTTIDLSYTNIEFCESNNASVAVWGSITHTCNFLYTSACTCANNFQPACFASTCAPVPSAPSTAPSAAPSSCLLSAKPGPEFTCVAGVWTAPTTNATTLTIPSGAGTVVITGNLPSESVVIQGLGNSIQVEGCAGNLTTITIEVDPSQLSTSTKTLQTLLTTGNASCSTDLNSVNLVTTAKSGCKKVKTQKVVSESGSTLSALFTLDRSGCNTWWIILVSVICGLILVGIIAVVLLAVFYAPFRQKIRPYSKPRQADGQGMPN